MTPSPIQAYASTTVRIGCRPTSIALVPAAIPLSSDTNTPPRYSACTPIATSATSRYSRNDRGQRAPVATAKTAMSTATSENR